MGIAVRIASADAHARRELAEQLALAGYACAGEKEEAGAVVNDLPEALVVAGQVLQKPVRLSVLLAHIKSLTEDRALSKGWVFSPAKRQLMQAKNAAVLPLTEKEVALLSALLAAPSKACTRASLLEQVWGYGDDISTHTLETHMHRLRAKLKDTSLRIDTAPQGYVLVV